jgi:azobenzene reductase
MTTLNLMVISAIGRPDSSCYQLATTICEMCAADDVNIDFVTPTEVGLPVNDGMVPNDLAEAVAWRARIAQIHCHIWVSPEYHSSMTGGMKNLFDYLGKEPMLNDVVGLAALAGGAMAALNTLNGMSVVARSLGAWVAPELVAVNSNDVKAGLGEGDLGRLQAMLTSVITMGRRIQD